MGTKHTFQPLVRHLPNLSPSDGCPMSTVFSVAPLVPTSRQHHQGAALSRYKWVLSLPMFNGNESSNPDDCHGTVTNYWVKPSDPLEYHLPTIAMGITHFQSASHCWLLSNFIPYYISMSPNVSSLNPHSQMIVGFYRCFYFGFANRGYKSNKTSSRGNCKFIFIKSHLGLDEFPTFSHFLHSVG